MLGENTAFVVVKEEQQPSTGKGAPCMSGPSSQWAVPRAACHVGAHTLNVLLG